MRIILVIFFLLCCSFAFSDELNIPFSCWSKELQTEFKELGRKLDLESSERTNDSWGYLVNKGSSYVIYTYNSVNPGEFEMIQKIVFDIEMKKRD